MDERHSRQEHMDELLVWFLRRIDRKLNALLLQGVREMATLAELATQVTDTRGIQESAVVLIQGIVVRLDEAIANGNPAEIGRLRDELKTSSDALAAAVVAGSPPVEPPPQGFRR